MHDWQDLVHSNLGFVVRIASEYRGKGVPFDDLVSEGNLGLIEAARRYDPDRGTKFITYAVWWIRKAMLSALSRGSRVVNPSAYESKKLQAVRQARERLRALLHRAPTRAEISRELSFPEHKVESILRSARGQLSLDAPVGESESTVHGDFVPDSGRSAEDRVLLEERLRLVVDCLDLLDPRERDIIGRRFGLDGEPPQTLQEIAVRVGLSRERVRQIEDVARTRLRRLLTRRDRPWPRDLAAAAGATARRRSPFAT